MIDHSGSKNHSNNAMAIFYLNIFFNVIYPCNGKAVFSASLLQSLVSHDPSETILIGWCSRNISDYYQLLKTVELHNIFVKTVILFSEFVISTCSLSLI